MSRFFVDPRQVGTDTITIEDRNDLKHMGKVLRLQIGDEVEIADGCGWEYRTRILSLDQEEALLTILDKQKCSSEPATRITLYQGIPKQSKMETIIQKCVELGVDRIVPVFMDRTIVVDKGNFARKIDRWQKVASESVKQCRRGMIPEVTEAVKMKQVLEQLTEDPFDLILIPYENEEGTTLKDVLRSFAGEARNIAVIIGPEGGFSQQEVDAVTAAGGHSVTLGKTTLRTETAGMAAIAMIMYELEL